MKLIGLFCFLFALSSQAAIPSGVPNAFVSWSLPLGRSVYVAQNGLDSNPGTQMLPFKTPSMGLAAINANKADSVLFRRGDNFILPYELSIARSGAQDQKIVIGCYGQGARPILGPYGFNLTASLSHLVFAGLHLIGSRQINDDGIRYVGVSGSDILIEDMEIEGYFDLLAFDVQGAPFQNLVINRNALHDSWGADVTKFSQCLYAANVSGLMISQNSFSHCGYVGPNANQTNIFNHAAYIQLTSFKVTAYGNNVLGNQDAFQMREGGVAVANFFDQNAVGLTLRQLASNSQIINNVFLHAGDINVANPRGVGILLDMRLPWVATNSLNISSNYFAFYDSAKLFGMAINASNNPSVLSVSLNQSYAFPSLLTAPGAKQLTAANNKSMPGSKDLSDYLASIGIKNGTLATFQALTSAQNSQNWNPALTGDAVAAWFLGQ